MRTGPLGALSREQETLPERCHNAVRNFCGSRAELLPHQSSAKFRNGFPQSSSPGIMRFGVKSCGSADGNPNFSFLTPEVNRVLAAIREVVGKVPHFRTSAWFCWHLHRICQLERLLACLFTSPPTLCCTSPSGLTPALARDLQTALGEAELPISATSWYCPKTFSRIFLPRIPAESTKNRAPRTYLGGLCECPSVHLFVGQHIESVCPPGGWQELASPSSSRGRCATARASRRNRLRG